MARTNTPKHYSKTPKARFKFEYNQEHGNTRIATCTSEHCCGGRLLSAGVVKNVRVAAIDCPDCKSALFWMRASKDRSFQEIY